MAADYASWSGYCYVLGNPVQFIDLDGRSAETFIVGELAQGNAKAANQLIGDLESVSGLDLDVSETTGKVTISGRLHDENGDLIKGSKTARKELKALIESKETTVSVFDNTGNGNQVVNHENRIGFDANQTGFTKTFLSENLNKQTWGAALIFFHELGHTEYGGSFADTGGNEALINPGEVERIPNIIRGELGSDYGIRSAYKHTKIGDNKYLPFSKKSLEELKQGKVPSSSYHRI